MEVLEFHLIFARILNLVRFRFLVSKYDNLHYGKNAQLEVFALNGAHEHMRLWLRSLILLN